MKDEMDKSQDHKCPPAMQKRANQPKPPGHEKCDDPTKPAQPPDPLTFECPESKCPCDCPSTPADQSLECLENLVKGQPVDLGAAEKDKLKAELVKFVETAKTAKQEYTQDNYVSFKKRWKDLDGHIANLLMQLECIVPCWKCVIECQVCALLDKLRKSEKRLYGDEKRYETVADLQDKQYWLTREKDARERNVDRVRKVVDAWGSPATTIAEALKKNEDQYNKIHTHPGQAIFEIFFELIPLHLAIAPPANVAETDIDIRFTEFCTCGEWETDDCCGPDVSMRSFRERLTPPQAYIINPDEYFKVMCCLIEKKFKPAAESLIDANVLLTLVNSEIASLKAEIGEGWIDSFKTSARAAIPTTDIDCSKFKPKPPPPPPDPCDPKPEPDPCDPKPEPKPDSYEPKPDPDSYEPKPDPDSYEPKPDPCDDNDQTQPAS